MKTSDLGKLLACEECQKMVPRYVSGSLNEEEAGRVRGHVGVCEACDLFLGEQIAAEVSTGRLVDARIVTARHAPAHGLLQRLNNIIDEAKRAEEFVDVARSFMGLRERFEGSLRAFLQNVTPLSGSELVDAINQMDPLAVVPAGEAPAQASGRVETSPTYYTRLMTPPEMIFWSPSGDGPWQIQARTIDEDEIFKQSVDGTSVSLPASVQQSIPRNAEIYWEVRRAAASRESLPLVRGVFNVLAEDEAERVNSRLSVLRALPPRVYRELAIAAHYFKSQLYDSLIRYLRDVATLYPDSEAAFILQRALASGYAAVHRELTGTLLMGIPEGLWAAEMANNHLQTAYRVLGVGVD